MKKTKTNLTEKKAFTIDKIKDTPFSIIEKDNECFIVCGKIKAEKKFKNYEEAKKYIKTKPWELIALLTEVMYNYMYKEKKNI